jgi:hypothetical protein
MGCAGWAAGAVPDAMAAGGAVAAEGATAALPNGLAHEVLGYLPYWMLNSSAIATIDFDRLSTIAYFSVGANPDGTLLKTTGTTPSTGWAGWTSDSMTQVTNLAHARGVRVVLTVTFMSWNGDYTRLAQLLNDPARRAALAAEISSAVKSRNADGVNVDFEPVPASLRDQFTAFVRELKARLVADGAGSYLTVATMAYAATSSSLGYDVVALSAPGAADALMVMGYDFHWSGSMRAGAVAPLRSPYIADVTDALLPMVYPSHYPRGSWGFPRPNAEPYAIVHRAVSDGVERSRDIPGAAAIIPWLQAFTLGDPPYGAAEIRAQIQGTYDAGVDEWILWSPSVRYPRDAFEPAIAIP